MFNLLKKVLKQIQATNVMSSIEKVKANVPLDAQYVTVVDMVISQGPVNLSATRHSISGASDSMEGVDASSISNAYMLHDGNELQFISENQQLLFSTPLSNIVTLQSISSMKISAEYGVMRGGFVCMLRDGRNIVVSTPMPVAKDSYTQFRTIGRSSDITGGWSSELEPFGVETIY